MVMRSFILIVLLQLAQYSSHIQCQEPASGRVTLTVEVPDLKEGISEVKDELTGLKEAVASLVNESNNMILMMNNNMTDLQDIIESSKMEILHKIAELQLSCCKPGSEEPGQVYRDCKDAYELGETKSGVYTINPDSGTPFDVYCEMEIDGGGWTVFQRRKDGSQDFFLYWDDYEHGFGNLTGEFWLGLSSIHRLTARSTRTQLRIDLTDFTNTIRYAKYNTFAVGDSSSNYILTATGYNGNAGDCLEGGIEVHNGRQFTTRDHDNDRYGEGNCAVRYSGAWWYDSCHRSNLNGLYLGGSHSSYANGIEWTAWKGYYYSLKFTEMKLRRV